MHEKNQNVSQPQPASTADIRKRAKVQPVASEEPVRTSATPKRPISIVSAGPQETDFPKFDLGKIEGMSESERRADADSMDLSALANFIRPALIGIKRLVEAYRPYVQNFMERTAHQGEQKMLTNKKGEPASREEVVREQLGVGVRRINQLLAATGPEPPKLSRKRLTELQEEVVQAVVEQGFAKKDAVAMTKGAQGEDFASLFRSALSCRVGGANADHPGTNPVGDREKQNEKTEESSDQDYSRYSLKQEDVAPASNPATEATEQSAPSEPVSVTHVTHADMVRPVPPNAAADQLREALSNEPDRDVASRMLTEHLRAYAEEQFANDRIQIKEVKVTVEFAGRDHRIMPGDWLEKREPNLTPTLNKCTGIADFMKRRRVKEWIEGKWGNEHVIFPQREGDYRVISEEVARRLAPEAFPSSPTTPEGL